MDVGRYRVIEVLGEGASGVVYRAADGEEEFAVKVLRASDEVAERRFHREVRLAGAAESRHLISILELGDGYFVMPLYTRGSLAARLAAGPLPVDEAVRAAAELGQALDALHAVGIVHRDVKPSNVLIADDGSFVLADFGLARDADSTRLTREGALVGTVHYLAPELIEGSPASAASDIYALGCLLYACLAGAPPFEGRAEAELGYAHLVEPPPDPRLRRPELPADVATALLTALEKEPSGRPTTATALARMLHLASTSAPG